MLLVSCGNSTLNLTPLNCPGLKGGVFSKVDSKRDFISKRGSPLYKLFGAGWGQKGVGGFF